MNTLSTNASISKSFQQRGEVSKPACPSVSRRLGRFVSVSLQLAILAPLAPAILLAWAVYWCVDGESLEQASRPTITSPVSSLPRILFNSDVPQIGVL